ncbi:phospholipase D-like domain-containing protein [Flindersiella endophytica]
MPAYGADGMYGAETAAAVSRFMAEAVEMTPISFGGEVDARAIHELDRVQRAFELSVDEAARISELDDWLTIPVGGRPPRVTIGDVHAHATAEHARSAFRDAVTACTGDGSFVADTALVPAGFPVPGERAWRLDLRWAYDGARLRAFCGTEGQFELSGPAAECLYADARQGTELPSAPAGRGGAFLQRTRVFRDDTERTAFLLYAIARARQFIYVEDPPLGEDVVVRQLAARLETLEALIVVLPRASGAGELRRDRRRRFLDQLAPSAEKVAVVYSSCERPPAGWWIFDDLIAAAGPIAFGDIIEPGAVVNLRTALWNSKLGRFAAAANARPATTVSIWRAYGADN